MSKFVIGDILETGLSVLGYQDQTLSAKIKELEGKRSQMEIASQLMHTFALGKQSKEGININNPQTRELIVFMHRCDERIFAELVTIPEGILSQSLVTSGTSKNDLLSAAMEGLTPSEIEIKPIPKEAFDSILRRLGDIADGWGVEANRVVSDSSMIWADQGQITEILRDINEMFRDLNKLILSHTGR